MQFTVIVRATGQTLDTYKAAAERATPIAPTSTHGGRFIDAAEASGASASPVSSTTPMPMPSSSPSSATNARPQGKSSAPLSLVECGADYTVAYVPMGLMVGVVSALARRGLA